jgi:hypothetical protein
MSEARQPNIIQVLLNLHRQDEGKHLPARERPFEPGMALLRMWQSRRLAGTYADLLANPEFGAQPHTNDIYAPRFQPARSRL